jgi:hypothetical protein
MENDIFLMSVAILNAWRTGHVTKNYSAVIASKEFELLKTIVVPQNKFITEGALALSLFGHNLKYCDSNIYINFIPNANIASCAKMKEVGRLVYYGDRNTKDLEDYSDFCINFDYNFGSIIDLLATIDK